MGDNPRHILGLLSITYLCLIAFVYGLRSERTTSSDDVQKVSLFDKAWSPWVNNEDDLQKVRQFHDTRKSSFLNKEEYLKAKSVGEYLNLQYLHEIHLPIPLNLLFIGFDGEGNQGIRIKSEDLSNWFDNLDHIVSHTRVPLSQLSCQEDGHCVGPGMAERLDPVPSYVTFNLSCHAFGLNTQVQKLVERALRLFSRPVDPYHDTGAQQVDAYRMDSFLGNMLKLFGLHGSYSILVLNPSWNRQKSPYGYSPGFTRQEIHMLKADAAKILKAASFHVNAKTDFGYYPGFQYRQGGKFVYRELSWEVSVWLTRAGGQLDQEEELRKELLSKVGVEIGAATRAQALWVLKFGDKPRADKLRRMLEEFVQQGDDFDDFSNKMRVMQPLEECAVDAWVGQERWAMLDLSATGSDWGPYVGGQGMKMRFTVPNVNQFFGKADKEALDQRQLQEQKDTGVEIDQEVLRLSQHLQASFDAKREERVQMVRHEQAMKLAWKDEEVAAPGEQIPEKSPVKQQPGMPDETVLRAELDVVEEFAQHHCQDYQPPLPPICTDLKYRAQALQNTLHTLSGTTGNVHNFERDHKWDIFGQSEVEEEEGGSEEVRAYDKFMSSLGSLLSRAIRHVIVPPTATWHHETYIHDTATPYTQFVKFTVYLVRDFTWGSKSGGKQNKREFDLKRFEEEIMSLKLNEQQFEFIVREIALHTDPALAVAFSAALKSSTAELPYSVEQSEERLYLDSAELAYQLTTEFEGEKIMQKGKKDTLHVPIFIFSVDRDQAVFIDTHYLAKGLKDMVLVVHNAQAQGLHPMGIMCSGQIVGRDLTSPQQSALSAVATHLGGLLPPHLGYSPSHQVVLHDWLWSVGSNPLSLTSHGGYFSLLQKDAVQRSYILDAMDISIDIYNDAMDILYNHSTSEATFQYLTQAQEAYNEVVDTYQQLMDNWKKMITWMNQLDFSKSAELIQDILDEAWYLYASAQEIEYALHPGVCKRYKKFKFPVFQQMTLILMGVAVIMLFVVLATVCTKQSSKPKIN